MATPQHVSRLGPRDLSGIGLAATSFALSTGSDTLFKLLATGHPGYQLLAINALFALIPIFGRAFATGGPRQLATTRPLLHLVRACAGVMSSLAAIYAYARLPLTDFYAIVFAGPLLVTVLSSLALGEKTDRARWIAITVGFGGVLVITNPFHIDEGAARGDILVGRLAAFLSVFCYAVSVIMVRRMRVGESSMAFSFYGYLVSIAAGLVSWLVFAPPALTLGDVAHLALAGLIGGSASLCLMEAYHRAPIALVAPFQYTQIFWGAVASYVLWHIVPDTPLVTGASIVAACGLFVLYRDLRGKV